MSENIIKTVNLEISEETKKKMQQKMLEMLLYFKEFCDEHEITFYLIGGGAIGALREHGFVPWDDDVDCMMSRHDYEKFKELWGKYGDKERYTFCRSDDKVNYHHTCSSLRDPSTTFICTYNQNSDICHGISLEFGPLDAAPDSKLKRGIQYFWALVYSLFNAQRLPQERGKIVRNITSVVYAIVPSKKMRYKIWKTAEKKISKYSWNDCKYVRELLGSFKGMSFLYPKEMFTEVVYKDFEGYQMPLMKGYDKYLRGIFGDYMKRPPKEKQIAKHDLIYVDMDNPYTKYKDIYYFPEKHDERV